MSAPQDSIPGNGSDILDQMDQLRMDDRLGPDGEPAPKTDEEYAQAQLTLRAIVSSKEAGVIIGKGGKNVADLRDETGVKAGVSKVVQGVHDRVLTITGDPIRHILPSSVRSPPNDPLPTRITTSSPRVPRPNYCKMSAPQDSIPGNGSDILDQMDQLRMDDRLGPDGEPAPKTDEEYAQAQLTLRAIVSSKEAGVIIGKGGKNVADLRDETGVKAGVSKVVQGVHDRVLTITGGCDAISRAYAIVARALLEGAPAMGMGGVVQSNGTHPIKLLISHNQMGTIIGRQGLKIKHIQDASGVRMVAQKEMLPQSTERIVEVQGTPEGIQRAIWEICKCLVDDWQRGTGTVLYNPVVRTQPSGSGNASGGAGFSQGSGRSDYGGSPRVMRTGNGADFSNGNSRPYNRRSDSDAALRGPPTHDENGEEIQTQNISIPADMVGCIIGRAGSKISEIRKTSGARISIAKAPHDETGERMFTIMGTAKANESALFLLYENLEAEKMRRSQLQEPE
ncbi:RNA-binding protein rnc1 [Fusarium odoratissimum]|uniref:RNA-binding protein rnc1 n=17 Tax=Fusarium oxysporum species complex TaxID=171631 RepID=N1RIQ7_FUSC4|nr:RNA-binding protein rnc1 [Fusarium odoratissimum]